MTTEIAKMTDTEIAKMTDAEIEHAPEGTEAHRLAVKWWAWHDASQVRHSPTMEEALARCAAWVRGESDDGPHLTVTMEPAEDEDECERLGLRRIYTVRSGSRVVWAGEADSEADALSHVR